MTGNHSQQFILMRNISFAGFISGLLRLMAGPVLLLSLTAGASGVRVQVNAKDFGLHADGKTDDGPVIQRILEAVREIERPVQINFPYKAEIYAACGTDGYLFRLDEDDDILIAGGSSTFLLQDDLRFLNASVCKNLEVKNLQVDMASTVVAEATITNVSSDRRTMMVRLDEPQQAAVLSGPTHEGGEQAFFGMIWLPGKFAMESSHCLIQAVHPEAEDGRLSITLSEPLSKDTARRIKRNRSRVSLPVSGIAHRYGPGPMIRIDRCENVRFEAVEVWAAPWFAYEILRNCGELVFLRTHIRPRPGSGSHTSAWRDGFHVKGNSADILFDGCIIEGTNDDSFNISSHAWRVSDIIAPDRIQIKQVFAIQAMPPRAGGNLLILSADRNQRIATVGITEVSGITDDTIFSTGEHPAPPLELKLAKAVDGLEEGCVVWDLSASNPSTVIRNCTIHNSARFQSPVRVENCDVHALLYFYSEGIEGPVPSGSVISNSKLRQGRGNSHIAVAVQGWFGATPKTLPPLSQYPMQSITFNNNTFWGDLKITGVRDVNMRSNSFRHGSLIEQ